MSCAPLCNVPRAGGGRTLVPMTSQAGHRQLLYAPEDAVSAAIDVRVPRAERGTDVPACAGCPGIVDCARGFTRLTPGPAAAWDPSEQKSAAVMPCKQPWSELGGKSTGTPVSDARGRVLVLREVHDLIGNEPCQAVLRGIFAAHTLGMHLVPSNLTRSVILMHVVLGILGRGCCWGSACSAHSHRLPASDPKSNS